MAESEDSMIQITVYGSPAPQGSKSFKGMSKSGHAILAESSKAVKPWREAVKYAALERTRPPNHPDGFAPLPGPLLVEITFTLAKPKSAPKSRRTWPDKKPDLSKLVRSTEDALTDAGVWQDDARVIDCHARKVFPGEHPKALHIPGAVIEITEALPL